MKTIELTKSDKTAIELLRQGLDGQDAGVRRQMNEISHLDEYPRAAWRANGIVVGWERYQLLRELRLPQEYDFNWSEAGYRKEISDSELIFRVAGRSSECPAAQSVVMTQAEIVQLKASRHDKATLCHAEVALTTFGVVYFSDQGAYIVYIEIARDDQQGRKSKMEQRLWAAREILGVRQFEA
jgi:hypothetical protein